MANDDPKQTHFQGCPYVQITFKPAGQKKLRTLWAIKLATGHYIRAGSGGGEWTDPKAPIHTVRKELIICTPDEVNEKPAAVNLTYGEMEVLDATTSSQEEA